MDRDVAGADITAVPVGYFAGADITETPVGYFAGAEDLTETVNADYEGNRGNSWGAGVYFMITKTIK